MMCVALTHTVTPLRHTNEVEWEHFKSCEPERLQQQGVLLSLKGLLCFSDDRCQTTCMLPILTTDTCFGVVLAE